MFLPIVYKIDEELFTDILNPVLDVLFENNIAYPELSLDF